MMMYQRPLAAAATIGLLSLDCTAFAPTANDRSSSLRCTPSILSSSGIRPRHFSSQLSQSDRGSCSDTQFDNSNASRLRKRIVTFGTSVALIAAVLASPINVNINTNNIKLNNNNNNPMIVSIERSQALAITENQQFVADVWFAVSAQYFDQSFNGLGEDGWRLKEKEAMRAVADTGPDDDEAVGDAIKTMLGALDDPYTRFLPRAKYEALTAYATGRSGAGIGVQLLEDPRTKNVVVMATTAGGPAAVSGIEAGDVILRVDGESVEGASADAVAAKCRGDVGGKIDLDLLRRSDDDGGGAEKESTKHATLTRATINANPMQASTFVSPGGKTVGLLRVPSFSTETVSQMVNALRSVSASSGESSNDGKKVDAIAIDLRGNVGGYMPAGVDAAKLFLPARAHIIAEAGKPGSSMKAYDADGIGAETSTPLYLLVDKRTASASEIFAAALQDNQRAVVVGMTNTFGKGRIQNVQPLENGSGVAVTRARYITPRGRDIHGVGIVPDRQPGRCEIDDSARKCLGDVVDLY